MAEYTPSIDTARECFVDGAAGEFIAEDFDRVLESVRAAERERIARDIEVKMRQHDRAQVGFSAIGDAYADAARIAREGD